jgi:hypothetical protein
VGREGVACRAMLFNLHELQYEPVSPVALSICRLCVVFYMIAPISPRFPIHAYSKPPFPIKQALNPPPHILEWEFRI